MKPSLQGRTIQNNVAAIDYPQVDELTSHQHEEEPDRQNAQGLPPSPVLTDLVKNINSTDCPTAFC